MYKLTSVMVVINWFIARIGRYVWSWWQGSSNVELKWDEEEAESQFYRRKEKKEKR